MTRTSVSLACIALMAAFAVATPPASAHPAEPVAGTWQTIVPASLTSYQPSAADPTTGTYAGVGSTLWQGTWTGVTHYTIQGTANLVTGAGYGTLQETFAGRAAGGGTGTLEFTETYTLDPTGHVFIRATILGATGDFACSSGAVTFEGTEVGIVTGSGSYVGSWLRREVAPRKAGRC